MADKFRTVYPINVTFAEGEQPNGRKLNAINTQTKNGLALIERALGDIWNQSGDSLYKDHPLYITNLARALGDQSKLNPKLPSPNLSAGETVVIRQATAESTTELSLDFRPVDPGTLGSFIVAAGYTTKVNSREQVDSSQKFYIDTENAKVFLGSPWPQSYIEYDVSGENFPSESQSANIIPHPEQEDWNGLKISKISEDKYLLYLPPRRPLSSGSVGKIPPGLTNSVEPGVSPKHRYWYVAPGNWAAGSNPESDSNYQELVTDKRYRYKLPEPLYNLMTEAGSAGLVFPSGSIYLWDNLTKTIIEGLTFRVPSTNTAYGASVLPRPVWVIQVEGPGLDSLFSGSATADDTDNPEDYKSRFSLITTGNATANAVDSAYQSLLGDSHSTGLLPRVRHSDLLGNQPHSQSRFTPVPPSYIEGDDHPHLLSRQGSTTNTALQRDRFNNGMMGDLLLLSKDPSNNRQNTLGDSQALVFGSFATGPIIKFAKDRFPTGTEGSGGRDALQIMGYGIHLEPARIGFPGGGIVHSEDYGELYTYGSGNQYGELDFFTGSVNTVYNGGPITGLINTSKSIKLHSLDTANRIDFLGNDLSLLSPGESRNVIVGDSSLSPNTHLVLANRLLIFGTNNNLRLNNTTEVGDIEYLRLLKGASSLNTRLEAGRLSASEGYLHLLAGSVNYDGYGYHLKGPVAYSPVNVTAVRFVSGSIFAGTEPRFFRDGTNVRLSSGLIVDEDSVFNGDISITGNIVPNLSVFNLGSLSNPWSYLYTGNIVSEPSAGETFQVGNVLHSSIALISFNGTSSGIKLLSNTANSSLGFIEFTGTAGPGNDIVTGLSISAGDYDLVRVRVNNQVRWLRCYH